MPPEMITIVAPIAMIAKKLASVAVWMSVYEFQKLFTVAPVTRSGCEPASSVNASVTSANTMTSPISCEPIKLSSESAHAAKLRLRAQLSSLEASDLATGAWRLTHLPRSRSLR